MAEYSKDTAVISLKEVFDKIHLKDEPAGKHVLIPSERELKIWPRDGITWLQFR